MSTNPELLLEQAGLVSDAVDVGQTLREIEGSYEQGSS